MSTQIQQLVDKLFVYVFLNNLPSHIIQIIINKMCMPNFNILDKWF